MAFFKRIGTNEVKVFIEIELHQLAININTECEIYVVF